MSPRDDEIFAEALELPAAERAEFLRRLFPDDEGRRARLDALLRGHERASDFLRVPLAALGAVATSDASLGRVGRYQLLEKIGEGGCGVVYLAEQQEPVRRRVALKVIKLGMDTHAVVARFEAERQALAMMDHPNIAKVFDAGATDSGRPYFVMELVRGIPITAYCDQKRLTIRRRVELFIPVCAALHHAHQKGIVHRDLKPSNLLVTETDGTPGPKVIDFGVAKATQGRLTEHTLFTTVEQFIGTPVYMSPEQAELTGLDVDARSDIYALGVLLYELLAGRPPFDPQSFATAGIDAIRRQIREVDPPRPSLAAKTSEIAMLLRGDLDRIVMHCLEKDRACRYATGHELADDLRRTLDHQPIQARPRSPAYVARKFVRRHRSAIAAAAVLLGALALGLRPFLRPGRSGPGVTVSPNPAPPLDSRAQARQLTERAFALTEKLGFVREDLVVAQDLARQATDLDPTSARAWGVSAWVQAAYMNRNWDSSLARRQAAQEMAKHALSLDPNEPEALNALAQVLIVQRQFAAAEQLARHAAASAPANFRSRALLADALEPQGRDGEALKILLEAERLSPMNPLIHYSLASRYIAYSRPDGQEPVNLAAALNEYRTIMRIHPFAAADVMYANACMLAGDLQQARVALDELKRMPVSDQAEDRAVNTAARYGLYTHEPARVFAATELTADTYFDDATVLGPKAWLTALAQLQEGHVNLARQEWESAESVLRQRLQSDPVNRERYGSELAMTLAWLGRTGEAAQWIAPLQRAAQDELNIDRAGDLALYYGAMGDARLAAYYLQRSWFSLGELEYHPWWDKVRSSPEFQAELKRVRERARKAAEEAAKGEN